MSRPAWGVIAIVAAACGKDSGTAVGAPSAPARPAAGSSSAAAAAVDAGAPAPAVEPDAPLAACEPLPFAASTPVPEASGAAWLEIEGKPALVVVSDSGNRGAYTIVDAESGETVERGALPLSSDVSDDIEGVAARGGKMFGVTSSGWIQVWRRKGRGFELVGKPYPLGAIEGRAPRGDGMVCNPHGVNCGKNYEGLCLAPAPRGTGCVGFAASKADGHLYCLTDEAGKLAVHRERAIAITRPGSLSDCAFSDNGTLWAGSNLFDLGNAYRVAGWEDPAKATVERVGALVVGFPELIAARGDVVYRMSDMGGAPSLMARYRCRP